MTRLILILSLVSWTNLFACTCGTLSLLENQKRSFNESTLIFVGDVIESDSKAGTYTFQIVETFKGEIKTKTIKGKYLTSCSGFPKEGRWLIYANTFENGLIDFDDCGMSRSFDNPQHANVKEYRFPPPPKKETYDSILTVQEYIDIQKIITNLRQQALIDIDLEIKGLRTRK